MLGKEWTREYFNDYVVWLEDTLFNIIKKNNIKRMSVSSIEKVLGSTKEQKDFIQFLLEKDKRNRKQEQAFLFNIDTFLNCGMEDFYIDIVDGNIDINAEPKQIEALQVTLAEILYHYGNDSNIISNMMEHEKLLQELPLLKTYPVSLFSKSHEVKDIEAINNWEMDILYDLLKDLPQVILSDEYREIFNKKIFPYKDWFTPETYNKMLPENVEKYFFCRINTSIPWGEMASHSENQGISIITLLEHRYYDCNVSMDKFENMIGQTND